VRISRTSLLPHSRYLDAPRDSLAASSWTTEVPRYMPTGFEPQSLVDSQDAFTATCGMAMVARHIYEDFYAPKPTHDISSCNRHLRPAVVGRIETLQVELDEVHDSWNARLRSYDRQITPCSGTGLSETFLTNTLNFWSAECCLRCFISCRSIPIGVSWPACEFISNSIRHL
jgi:hypothetical protein